MKKKILVTVLSVAMVLSAGACGSGNGQPADGASSADNASSANAVSDDLNNLESIELSYAHMGSESSMVGQWGQLFKSKLKLLRMERLPLISLAIMKWVRTLKL